MSVIQRTVKLDKRQLSNASIVALTAMNEAETCKRSLSIMRSHLVLVWIAIVALALKVCL